MNEIFEEIGEDMCLVLLGLHAFTGCDTVSAFAGKGKATTLKVARKDKEFACAMSKLGETVDDRTKIVLEPCRFYINTTKITSVNELRFILFCGKQGNIESHNLPPCQSILHKHISRANYQAMIWKKALYPQPDKPSPEGHGWLLQTESDGNNDCFGTEAFSYGIETVEWYKEFKKRGLKCGGAWSWCNPVLIVTVPGYIKEILLKSFSSFTTRDFYHNPKYDPKNENLFVVDKEVWKNLRQKLTPVYTTAKMKLMFLAVVKCTEPMMDIFAKNAETEKDMDMRELLINLYETTKDEEKPFTFDDLIGNVILFFTAGFDTSSTAMNFALYELALNPKLQDRTREDIRRVLDEHKGALTYESLKEMTYLGQVIDAKRFGLMQTAIGLIQVLKDYKVSISPKTKMPLTLKKGVFLVQINETLYLRITKA
ncbi:unnamed protein product [Ceutorhynchus assimilis]|uniref:Cytochrome P450 n=1 Tax=Ceutorhynchus assimilis TaxID=467358 RepID=A0A9N9QND7_9CUCU|nr:unnamed protein product [Ceutorhynchus assimilis]